MLKHRVSLGVAILVAVAFVGWFMLDREPSRGETAPAAHPPVPVTMQAAQQMAVPIYLHGLGTVQAFNAVEVKAQVSGMVLSIPVREGQEVRQGDIVAVIDPRPYQAALDQATAQKAEDQAQLEGAKLDLRRYQDLATRSFAPVQQVDDQRATVDRLTAALQADSAAIETAEINVGFCTIRAPINGRVSLRQTDIGNVVQVATQTGIVSIMQDKPISVVFTLPEADLPRVHDAMRKGALPVEVYATDGGAKLAEGTLLTPNNAIDTTTGTIPLKATFANEDSRLWPVQFVYARLLVGTLPDAVTVPVTAVVHGPEGLFVYTVRPDGTVAQQPVEVGYQDSETAMIASGVQPGTQVVSAGQARLAPGTPVVPANATPSGPTGNGPAASGTERRG